MHCESKITPLRYSEILSTRLRIIISKLLYAYICLLHVNSLIRPLCQNQTKLCHIMCDQLVNVYISLRI